jgi:hypothetical protein
MSRENQLSEAITKRSLEAALREAGLSCRDAKRAISVFCRFMDRGEIGSEKRSTLGKIFTRLKRKFAA